MNWSIKKTISLWVIALTLISCSKNNDGKQPAPQGQQTVGQPDPAKKHGPVVNPPVTNQVNQDWTRQLVGNLTVNTSSPFYTKLNDGANFAANNCFKRIKLVPPAGHKSGAFEIVELYNLACNENPTSTNLIATFLLENNNLYASAEDETQVNVLVGSLATSQVGTQVWDLCLDETSGSCTYIISMGGHIVLNSFHVVR